MPNRLALDTLNNVCIVHLYLSFSENIDKTSMPNFPKIIETMTSGPHRFDRAGKRVKITKKVKSSHFEHEIGKCELDT